VPTKQERDRIIQSIVRILFNEKAHEWSVQDKGTLMAAVKLQLQKSSNQETS
jgi:hypothetical protein